MSKNYKKSQTNDLEKVKKLKKKLRNVLRLETMLKNFARSKNVE